MKSVTFRNLRVLALTMILVTVSSVFLSSMLTGVEAQPVGLVCLAPASAVACPSPPVSFSAAVGTQLKLAVLVAGSDAFSGFDITLVANHTIIKPANANVTGSLLSGGTVLAKCIGGSGSMCSSTDGPDTIHVAMVGPSGFLTLSPVTGLLFTAIYNVTSTTTTPISYQTGCSPSSVNGTNTCVVFSNGSLSNPLETVQGGSYTRAPTPTFTIGTSTVGSLIVIAKGESANSTVTLSSINGFSGAVSMTFAVTPSVRHAPNVSLSSNSIALTNGGTGTLLVTASAGSSTTKGTYTITVTGTSGSQSGSVQIELLIVP